MMLIGMFDSPFVRRVAVSMKLLGLSFEHANWSVGRDFALIREYSPLGRVPTLVLNDKEVLIESAAILDYLDDNAGPERALLPPTGRARREALQIMAYAIGAAEKGREQIYEGVFRPADKRHPPWLQRCQAQMHGALLELERYCEARGVGQWLIGEHMTQADITSACVFTFLSDALALTPESAPYPALRALTARCEALPEFQSTKAAWFAPNG